MSFDYQKTINVSGYSFFFNQKIIVHNNQKNFIITSFILFISLFQCFTILKNNPKFIHSFWGFFRDKTIFYSRTMTMKHFYSPTLFSDIKNYIAIPESQYRLVSIGLHPSITLYNGFHVLDGYFIYSVEYKQAFRVIIEKELTKNNDWKHYFDDWGLRAYIFPSELNKYNYMNIRKDFNLSLKKFGIKYLSIKKNGWSLYFFCIRN